MKNKYGISLIVLIVTIIVMIIIAGAIIMTLSGTGIIDKAENGVDLHNQAVEREQIIMALSRYQLQKNTKDNPQTLLAIMQDELNKDAMVAGPANGPITVVFNRTQNKYVVYENGDIVGPTKAVDAALEEYILGPTREGILFSDIFDGNNFIDAPFDIELYYSTEDLDSIANGQYGGAYYIKYNNNEYYKFRIIYDLSDETGKTAYTDPVFGVQLIDKLDGTNKIGKQLKYAGMLWTVLYDDEEHGLQLISNNYITDLEGNKILLGAEDLDETIKSYNDTVTTLNALCNSKIPSAPGVIKNIRSIGSNPINPTTENKTLYTSAKFADMESNSYANGLNGKLYSADTHYISDIDQLIITNLLTPDNATDKEGDYWLASKYMYFYNDPITNKPLAFGCGPLVMNIDGGIGPESSLYLEESYIDLTPSSKYIRPVITLENDIINRLEGSGTTTEPYNLDKYYESIVIVTDKATSIANGTYYYLGLNDQITKLVIDDSNNQFCYKGVCNDATVTINNGTVTVDTVINDMDFTFNGNYYETKQNKILTLGLGDFGTTEHAGAGSKNGRTGFLLAINNKDLKHDIEGTYRSKGNGGFTLVFTKNTLYAHFSFDSNPDAGDFVYAGFKDMFYLNDCQILYTGLENGFGWQDPQSSGVYYKVKD